MKISQQGIDFIKGYESLELNAYLCPAGVLTIGVSCDGKLIPEKHASIGVSLRSAIRALKIESIVDAERALVEDGECRLEVAKKIARQCKHTDSGCIEWYGGLNDYGYGTLSMSRKATVRVHRASYILSTGEEIDRGLYVCHKCDNPRCVNPDHLFLGTPKDNMDDKNKKGRGTNPPIHYGEQHHKSKLTSDQVNEVRKDYARLGNASLVGRMYGVSNQTVRRINLGITRVQG